MNARLAKIAQNVDRLTLRERLFLFAALLVVLVGAWEAVLASPLAAREKIAGETTNALRDRIETLNQSVAATAAGMSEGMPGQMERLQALRDRYLPFTNKQPSWSTKSPDLP